MTQYNLSMRAALNRDGLEKTVSYSFILPVKITLTEAISNNRESAFLSFPLSINRPYVTFVFNVSHTT